MLKLFVKAQNALADIRKDNEGASLVEYAILLGLITIAVITIISTLGDQIAEVFNGVSDNLTAEGITGA